MQQQRRQLNLWNFRRRPKLSGSDEVWFHENFVRDNKEELKLIKRKIQVSHTKPTASPPAFADGYESSSTAKNSPRGRRQDIQVSKMVSCSGSEVSFAGDKNKNSSGLGTAHLSNKLPLSSSIIPEASFSSRSGGGKKGLKKSILQRKRTTDAEKLKHTAHALMALSCSNRYSSDGDDAPTRLVSNEDVTSAPGILSTDTLASATASMHFNSRVSMATIMKGNQMYNIGDNIMSIPQPYVAQADLRAEGINRATNDRFPSPLMSHNNARCMANDMQSMPRTSASFSTLIKSAEDTSMLRSEEDTAVHRSALFYSNPGFQ